MSQPKRDQLIADLRARIRRIEQGGAAGDRIRRRHGTPPPERPLVTLGPEDGRPTIAAIDAAARARGLIPGMSLAHARALVPDLATAPTDPAGDAAGLTRLAAWCLRRYSPLVAPDRPDGLWLDIGGCAHLFGGERAMLEDMTARLARASIHARAALRWSLAIQGDLREMLRRENRDAAAAVTGAMTEAAEGLKQELRGQVRAAGLGNGLANSWRSRAYPNRGLDAAAFVWSNAPDLPPEIPSTSD